MSDPAAIVHRLEQLRAAVHAEVDALVDGLLDAVREGGVREEKKRSRQVKPKRPAAIVPNDLEMRMARNTLQRIR